MTATTEEVFSEEAKTIFTLHSRNLGSPRNGERPFTYYQRCGVYMAVREADWAESEFVPLDRISHFSLTLDSARQSILLSQYVERENDPHIDDGCLVCRGRFNLRLRPPGKKGPWFTTDEIDIVGHGLVMHEAARDAWYGRLALPTNPSLPPLYAIFKERQEADITHQPTCKFVLSAAQKLSENPLPATINQQFGTVASIRRRPDAALLSIRFVEQDCSEISLPYSAILRPGVTVGASLMPGVVVADPIPPCRYQSWEQLNAAVGERSAQMFAEAVFQSAAAEALGGYAYPAYLFSQLTSLVDDGVCYLVRRFEDVSTHMWPQPTRVDEKSCGLIFTAKDGTTVNMQPAG